MSAPAAEQPPAATSRRFRGSKAAPTTTEPTGMAEPPKLRRRPLLVALSVLLTALGALLGAWVLTALSGSQAYIAVRQDVQRGEVIEADDLVRTQLSKDAAVTPLRWDQQRLVVGQRAAVDMAAGSVVTKRSVSPGLIPGAGDSVVGLALDPGQVQASELKAGDPVRVVLLTDSTEATGATGQQSAAETTPGSIAAITTSADGTARLVDVIVSNDSAATVAQFAARRQVSLVLDSREQGEASTGGLPSPTAGSGASTGSTGSSSPTGGSTSRSPSS